jgi:hypothetical protein
MRWLRIVADRAFGDALGSLIVFTDFRPCQRSSP